MPEILRYIVKAMRNVGQKEWHFDYERLKTYERITHGPDYISIKLEPHPDSTDEERKGEIKLLVTEEIAERFRLGSIVEVIPDAKRKEVNELKEIFQRDANAR